MRLIDTKILTLQDCFGDIDVANVYVETDMKYGIKTCLGVAVVAIFMLAACSGPAQGPEAALRAWLGEAELATEARDRRALLMLISENYRDARGNDYEQIGKILRLTFYRQQSIALLLTIDEIVVSADSAALIRLTVGMAGQDNSLLGVNAQAYNFELELEADDDAWLLIGARWGEMGRIIH